MGRTIYMHFSSRRPKDEAFGMFSVACYLDREFKRLITREVVAAKLWDECQHLTSIQAYQNALDYIHRHQTEMKRANISTVILVTNNSSLVKWITQQSHNKYYNKVTEDCSKPYGFGQNNEITLGVGILEATDEEKSKRHCILKNVHNLDEVKEQIELESKRVAVEYTQPVEAKDMKYQNIYAVLDSMAPEEDGIVEV